MRRHFVSSSSVSTISQIGQFLIYRRNMAAVRYDRQPVPEGAIDKVWRRDIITSHAPMTTTGGQLWNAAVRLGDFLEAQGVKLGLTRQGVRILELGSGIGWLGMLLACNLQDAKAVVCTEQAAGGAMDWLNYNIKCNHHLPLARLQTSVCDWRSYDNRFIASGDNSAPDASAASSNKALDAEVWDFVLGSDLVYNEEGAQLLPKVLAKFSGSDTTILYCHTKRRFEHLDVELMHNLQMAGFTVQEVTEPWAPSPPASPEPFSELFPDMRLAILLLSRR